MPRNSFRHPVTGVLMAHGFVESNNLGEVKMLVSDDFALEPGKWRWDGMQWISFFPPPPPVRLDAEDVLVLLVKKGMVTQQDVDDAKAAKG